MRTVKQLPVEVGVGRHTQLDSFLVHWFNWPQGDANAPVDCQEPLLALEATIQEGSCPYLYVWDGQRFEFLTDILGAAPIGLPVAERRYIEPDPEEFVWIGNDRTFPPRNGSYEVRVTEELREVLYLDEAKLVVVDHAPDVEVHATDKLLPGGPFPAGGLMPVHQEHPLRSAARSDGQDVTSRLQQVDTLRASPPQLRIPQLRGLAETHGYVLDFGPIDVNRPLVLVLNGWLRFGGGMANVAASQDPSLPFPFPSLEAEITPGNWEAVDVVVGAPAGKTKTILVDLTGRLKVGTRRLRLTQSFEIHWDRMALMERVSATGDGLVWGGAGKPTGLATATAFDDLGRFPATQVYVRSPSEANLRFRGFGRVKDLPWDHPLTPAYENATANSYWTVIPEGWCSRYGDVSELVASRDEGLALIHAGDELGLRFRADALPEKPEGMVRDFFLYVDGWDKDSDFHVAAGTQLEPLPFHGMEAQSYGSPVRPAFPSDALHQRYNTRWVDGRALRQVLTSRSKE